MKRLILATLVLGLVGLAIARSGLCPIGRRFHDVHIHDTYHIFGPHGRQRVQAEYNAARQAKEDAETARREALEAIEEARRDVDASAREARESVDGIPVPIVPGTRVADASPTAPRPPAPPLPPRPRRSFQNDPRPNAPAQIRKVTGRVSATEERAKADARRQLRDDVATWLEPEVPSSWVVLDRFAPMIQETRITPVEKEYATVYVAELDVDFSDFRRADLMHGYQQTIVRDRMLKLAGLLGFVLACLAAVSGYIRTDEATKGYYTNRLRMLAAAGVGAAGVVIYQMIA